MGFLDLFKSKPKVPARKDLVWMSNQAKWQGLKNLSEQFPNALYLAWFPETKREAEKLVSTIHLCKEVFSLEGYTQVFIVEHYPLLDKETELLDRLGDRSITFLNSLDEPIFSLFGGDRIKNLMVKLGVEESESLEHASISASLTNMQRKIQEKVVLDFSANSQAEWIRRMNS